SRHVPRPRRRREALISRAGAWISSTPRHPIPSRPFMTAPILVRIWDAPLRLVHCLIVVCVALSWWTADNRHLGYHPYSGYTALGLLVFRLYWGFVGSETARFASFIKGPKTVLEYVRRLPQRAAHSEYSVPGHNPLGAVSVVVLLLLLMAQVGL